MTARKVQLKPGTVAEQGEGAKAERSLGRPGDKAAASIGGKTEGIAKPKLSSKMQKKLNKELIAALEVRELDKAIRLIRAGANVGIVDGNGQSPLVTSSYRGQVDVVKEFLAAGADINTRGNEGATPLIAASEMGHVELVRVLISGGADVNARDDDDYTALMRASFSSFRPHRQAEIVRELIAAGANVNARGVAFAQFGASLVGNTEIVKELRKEK